jgi:predicted AAA+ superfamily ATPase
MKKQIKLPFISELDYNLKSETELLQVILGPRQVGKTTTILNYLESHYKDSSHYVSADKIFNSSPAWIIEQWNIAAKDKKLLVIDEIQKCENWAETLKILWDKAKKNKISLNCILLGSSSLQIQKGLTESLTGRFQLIPVYHWNFKESNEGYNMAFESYLKWGGYPGSYSITNDVSRLNYIQNSIINTVIEKDILQYNSVKSPALFKQAFEILVSYPAQEISYTKLLGQIQDRGNVEMIKYYLQLFEGAFLIKALEKFSSKKIIIKSSSPKILPLAPCLFYLSQQQEYSPDDRGRAFEMIVGAQLVRTQLELFYWREGKFEVDFILKKGKRIWAVEVKSGRKKSTQGLIEFQKHFPNAKLIIITPDNYFEFEKNPLQFFESLS